MDGREPKRSLWRLWIVWALLVFGALNISAPPLPGVALDVAAQRSQTQAPGLHNLLVMLRDDGDTRRYFAYANAILGRPYDGYYLVSGPDHAQPPASAHVAVTPPQPLAPWRDFTVEYPPGMLLFALAPALLTSDFPTYHLLFSLLMGAMLTGAAALAVRAAERISPGSGRDALLMSILFTAALGVISLRRYDAPVALSIAIAFYGLVARRPALSGFGLGVAGVVKGAPLLLAPLGLILHVRARDARALLLSAAALALALAAGGAVFAGVAGVHAFDAFAYHADRPVQIESPYGAAAMLANALHPLGLQIASSFGSHNIEAAFEPALRQLATVITVATSLATLVYFALALGRADDQASRGRLTAAAAVALLIAFIAFGKVFSPQYLVWLLPCGAVAAALSSERSRVLFVAAALATQLEYPFIYQIDAPFTLLLIGATALVRDALLIGCALSLLADARPGKIGAAPAP